MTTLRKLSVVGTVTLLAIAGCNGQSSVVTGIVTLDGKPIAGGPLMYGTVSFYRTDGSGAPAVGIIEESGRYLLKTGTQGQLPPGDYLVGVSVQQITPPATPGGLPQPHLITHADYSSVTASGFRASVKPGKNTFDFALNSGGPPHDN